MTQVAFNIPAFFIYLVGCFTALVLALRSSPDDRVLPQTYGAWIAAVFAAHHLLVPAAAQTWHYVWYVTNAFVDAFPILLAGMLKDAGARKPVMIFGVIATLNCLVFAAFSFSHHPLDGLIYFYIGNFCEAVQVLSMVIWSGPVVPLCVRAWKFATERKWPWMHRVSV